MQDYQFNQDPTPGFIGFMDLDATLKAIQSDAGNPAFDVTVFPFYNIHSDDRHYMVDLAIPGYSAADLTIKVVEGVLTITGNHADPYDGVNSVFHGDVTPLSFEKSFRLFDTLVVDTIHLANGILKVKILKMLPDLSREGQYPVEFIRGTTPLIVPPAPVVVEAPAAEAPVADAPAPVVETPAAPVVEAPAPVADAPAADAAPLK